MPEIYRNDSPNIMYETIDGEVVIVNLDNGAYYSLDGVGGQIWNLLGGAGMGLRSLTAKLASRYAGERTEIESAVTAFVAQLKKEGLITADRGDDSDDADAAVAAVTPFVAPLLQKYTDMEALLLVDPIHEVDETGWPNLK